MKELYKKYKKSITYSVLAVGFIGQVYGGYFVYDKFKKINQFLDRQQQVNKILAKNQALIVDYVIALENKIKKLEKKWK